MGKNFPHISNLKEKPQLLAARLALIEKSFNYRPPHRFQEDFAALVHPSNHHNCFLLIGEGETVLAHIGLRPGLLKLGERQHDFAMLGGIAVAPEERGKGHFQQLMQYVLSERRDDFAFFLLWSDQERLYQKFGFTLCGEQYELQSLGPEEPGNAFHKTKLHLLDPVELQQIRSLYQESFQRFALTPERTDEDWQILAGIRSADVFYRREAGQITDYYLKNKGQDLTGIIYEYGSVGELQRLLRDLATLGKVWSPRALGDEDATLYQFSLATGDEQRLRDFIHEFTGGQITLRRINQLKGEVFFDFGEETLMLETTEFIRGIFGPGPFEELGEMRPLFISGLDSV